MDFKAHGATCDNSVQVYYRYRMEGKPRTCGVDSQKRKKKPVMEMSGDVSEKPGARHLPTLGTGTVTGLSPRVVSLQVLFFFIWTQEVV